METTKNTNPIENNVVTLTGEIVSEGRFSHDVFGEKFYIYDVNVARLSEQTDILPVTISERLLNLDDLTIGSKIAVTGQFRSYNKHEESFNRLILSVFARTVDILTEETDEKDANSVTLRGFVCKKPSYRKTPLGREISDVLLAVNRPYGKSDYIPCICWGRNARFADNFNVGDEVIMHGRIQSRTYAKKISETETENRTAYEVSVSKIELLTENYDAE